jgi:(1->4)-alpha-D-glucan 1-alpha-D-glucosylmutase
LFGADGGFTPLVMEGRKADHAVGYLRTESLATIVPRWSLKLGGNWVNTTVDLPSQHWRNLLTGESLNGGRVFMSDILRHFPVALLAKEES